MRVEKSGKCVYSHVQASLCVERERESSGGAGGLRDEGRRES